MLLPQVFENDRGPILIHNDTTEMSLISLSNLRTGISYDFVVRGVTDEGVGPFSHALKFSLSPDALRPTITNVNNPVPTIDSNMYMIIAIVSAAILVGLILLAVIICVFRRRNMTKVPHYFSKSCSNSGPWSGHEGCFENGSVSGIHPRYPDRTLTHLGDYRYMDSGRPIKVNNPTMYADGSFLNFKMGKIPIEELMYEDPEGLHLVSFGNRQNMNCDATEPYATTPLISGARMSPHLRHDVSNIPGQIDVSSMQHKESTASNGPVLQFPAPPPSHGSNSTNASDKNRCKSANNSLANAPFDPNSLQHSSLHHHLPYYNISDSSHHASPLLHPRKQVILHTPYNDYQVPTHPTYFTSHINNVGITNSPQPAYHVNLIPNPMNDSFDQIPSHFDVKVGSWVQSSSFGANETEDVDGAFKDKSRSSRIFSSPHSSPKRNDVEGKEIDESSCYSDEASQENKSSQGSISELNENLHWAEAVRSIQESSDADRDITSPNYHRLGSC